MIKLIVFDFDGTLVDSRKVVFKTLQERLKKKGLKIDNKFRREIGNYPLKAHLKIAGVKDVEKVAKEIKKGFVKNADLVKPDKEIESLSAIKIKKIILSNNEKHYLDKAMKKLDFKGFSKVLSAEKYPEKSVALKIILKNMKIKPSEVIYVGDKEKDSDVARKVGCISVIISHKASWSNEKEIINSNPDFIIKRFSDLPKVLEKLNSS